MTRAKQARIQSVGCKRRNCGAFLIACAGISILYLNFNPTPVGADPDELRNNLLDLQSQMASSFEIDSSASSGTAGNSQANPDRISGSRALLLKLLLLEKGVERLRKVPDYTATVYTQERVSGSLLDPQIMNLKIRHEPLSIYMRWLAGDKGRELLYVDGQNEGDMLVKMGGIKGKLIPPLKLNPAGDVALQEARYPVTKIGLLELAQELLQNRRSDLERKVHYHCQMLEDQKFNERQCYCFVHEFEGPEDNDLYRKSIVLIDKEWCLPVMIKNFTWPHESIEVDPKQIDQETLIEHYSYTDIRFEHRLADGDFDRSNTNYSFTR